MRFLLRNWHLKLGAVALATVLYTGLVFSGSFQEDTVLGVQVQAANPQSGWVMLGATLGTVNVTYRSGPDAPDSIDPSGFAATVDLSEYDTARPGQPQSLPVEVRELQRGVTVVRHTPEQVTVTLDELVTREIPVEVDYGELPQDLEIAATRLSVEAVTARGASSLLAQVDRAVAYVSIDPSGIDVRGPVPLVPVGLNGEEIAPIRLDPEVIDVEIDVRAIVTGKTVPVRVAVAGTPAAGFELAAISVRPQTVTLRGTPDVLRAITEVTTVQLSIEGAQADVAAELDLAIPEEVQLGGGSRSSVTVTAAIARTATSRTLLLGVVCQGAGANACLPGIDQVAATVAGPGDVIAGLDASDVTAIVDVSGLGPGGHSVPATVAGLPDGVELLTLSPGTVPLTVEPPATPTPAPTPTPAAEP